MLARPTAKNIYRENTTEIVVKKNNVSLWVWLISHTCTTSIAISISFGALAYTHSSSFATRTARRAATSSDTPTKIKSHAIPINLEIHFERVTSARALLRSTEGEKIVNSASSEPSSQDSVTSHAASGSAASSSRRKLSTE